jgi:hypothetical protein
VFGRHAYGELDTQEPIGKQQGTPSKNLKRASEHDGNKRDKKAKRQDMSKQTKPLLKFFTRLNEKG